MSCGAQLRACRFAASLLRDHEANSPFGGTASRSSQRATAGFLVAPVSARTGCVSSAMPVASAKNVTQLELVANPLKLPTPIRSGVFGKYLEGYDHLEKEFIINGFNNCFSLGSVHVNYSQNIPRNHKSTFDHPDILESKIHKELSLVRYMGPFPAPPFKKIRLFSLRFSPQKRTRSLSFNP